MSTLQVTKMIETAKEESPTSKQKAEAEILWGRFESTPGSRI